MNKLYKYTGSVSSYSYIKRTPDSLSGADLILKDLYDDDKAPIRIEAFGGLADYIDAIECTDAEERYLSANWYYDSNLFLLRIEIPSIEPGNPAKIIAQHDALDRYAFIFGPVDYIETSRPEPMNDEQCSAWYKFKSNDDSCYTTYNTKQEAAE